MEIFGKVGGAIKEGVGKVADAIKALFEWIWNALKKLGKIIQKKVLSFKNDVKAFVKKMKERKAKHQLAVTIKQTIATGEYQVVNCLYDETTEQVVDVEENCEGYEAEKLDWAAKRNFRGKDMIVY